MSTLYQRYKNGTFRKKDNSRTPALKKCPQVRGTVMRARIVTPRKPNSAKRPVGKVILVNKKRVTAHIPGIGHNIRRYSKVLVRGGGSRDLPGVRYSLIRGVMDFMGLLNKKRRRSIYGAPKKDRISKRRYERVPLHEFLKNNLDNFNKTKNDYADFKRELINLKILKRNKNLEDKNLQFLKTEIKNNDILLNSNLNSSDEYAEYDKFYDRFDYETENSDLKNRRLIRMDWRRLELRNSIDNYFNLNFSYINNKKINDNFLTFYFFFKNSLINYFFDLKLVYQLTKFKFNTNICVFVLEDYFKKLKYYLLGKEDLLIIFSQNIYYNNIFSDLYDYKFDIIYEKFSNFLKNSTKPGFNKNISKETSYDLYLNLSYDDLIKQLNIYLYDFSQNKNLKNNDLKNNDFKNYIFNISNNILIKKIYIYKFNIIKSNMSIYNLNFVFPVNLFKFSITKLYALNYINLNTNKYFFSFSNLFMINNSNKLPLRLKNKFYNNNNLNIFLTKDNNFLNNLKKLQTLEEKNIIYLRKYLLSILNCSLLFQSYNKSVDFFNRCNKLHKFTNKFKNKTFFLGNFQYNNNKSFLKSLYYLKKVFFKKSVFLLNFINNYFSKSFSNTLYNILSNFEKFNNLSYNSTLLLDLYKLKSRNNNFSYLKKKKNINTNILDFDLVGGKYSYNVNYYVSDEFDISGEDVDIDTMIPADLKESEFSLEQKIITKKKEFLTKYNGSYSKLNALSYDYKHWTYFNKDNKFNEVDDNFVDNFDISTLNNSNNLNIFNHNYRNILPYTENFFLYYNNLLPFYDEMKNIYILIDFLKINDLNFNNLDKYSKFINSYNLLTQTNLNKNFKKLNNINELVDKFDNKNILFYKPIFYKFSIIDIYPCINKNNLPNLKLNVSQYLSYSIHRNNFNKFFKNNYKFILEKKYFINYGVKKKFKKKISKKYNYIFLKLLLNDSFLKLSYKNYFKKINNKYYNKKIISNFSWLYFI